MDLAHKKARNLTKNLFNSLVEIRGDYVSSCFCIVTLQLSFPFFVLSAGMCYFCIAPINGYED